MQVIRATSHQMSVLQCPECHALTIMALEERVLVQGVMKKMLTCQVCEQDGNAGVLLEDYTPPQVDWVAVCR